MTEDETVGWHHRLNGHGFGWTPGVGDGQGSLACCSSWGRKESDMTETELTELMIMLRCLSKDFFPKHTAFSQEEFYHTDFFFFKFFWRREMATHYSILFFFFF